LAFSIWSVRKKPNFKAKSHSRIKEIKGEIDEETI